MAVQNSGVKISADVIKVKLLQEAMSSTNMASGESSLFTRNNNQRTTPRNNNHRTSITHKRKTAHLTCTQTVLNATTVAEKGIFRANAHGQETDRAADRAAVRESDGR